MKRRKVTFLGKSSHHPLVQALTILLVAGIGVAFSTISSGGSNSEWYIASTLLLVFACGNPIMGIFRKNWKRYVLYSIPSFLILGTALVLFTDSLAVNGIKVLGAFQKYFLAVTVFYFLTIFLVGIFRLVLNMINSIE